VRSRSATGRIHKFQAPGSEHADLGELELSNEWCSECQVASIDKLKCIEKACIKNRVVSKACSNRQGDSK